MKKKRLRSPRVLITLLVTAASFVCRATMHAGTQWQQLIDDKAFFYKDQKETYKLPAPHTLNPFEKIFSTIIAFFSSQAGKMLGWAIFFILLGWAFYMIAFSNRSSIFRKTARKMTEDTVAQPGEDMETDWEHLLQQAKDASNIRLAIRYSYMRLLQLLQKNGLIDYRHDKTNYDYYSELKDRDIKNSFRQMTRQYEYAWYGNFDVPKDKYEAYMAGYHTLVNKLHG